MLSRSPNNRGFTAIELMIATAILVVGMLPLAVVIRKTSGGLVVRLEQRRVLLYAQSMVDQIRTKKWDETTTTPYVLSGKSAIGLDGLETLTLNDFDDIDDYNTYKDFPASGFSRQVSVQYATVTAAGTVIVPWGAATDLKMVRVTVTKLAPPAITEFVETILCNGIQN